MTDPTEPIVFVDVLYHELGSTTTARVGVVWADSWLAAEPIGELTLDVDGIEDYTPGEFYRRELPCLLEAHAAVDARAGRPAGMVIDGNVRLDRAGSAGLGLHLFRALDERVPVIGIAKRGFQGLDATKVLRGTSATPLWVTAAGMSEVDAGDLVQSMAGPHRIPTLVRRADQLSRTSPI